MTFCLVVTGNKQSARGTNNPFRKTAVSMLMQALHQRLVKLQFPVLVEWIRLCRVRALLHLNSGHGRPQAAIRYAKRAREVVPSSRAVKRASWSNFLNCIVSGGLCFPKLVPRPTAEMAVTLLVATYHRRMLLGVAKAVPGEPETDPRSFGLKLDDPDGHLHLEQVLLGPGEAVISRVSSFPAFHRVRLAEEMMRAYSDEPLSVLDLANALGVSLRSLQLAFAEVHGGLTPRAVLYRIRLEKARARLLAADEDSQVTTIAHNSGFSHLSRFAQAYTRAYGERPSETLYRRRT
jgi:AraC-like DNA-binding protein